MPNVIRSLATAFLLAALAAPAVAQTATTPAPMGAQPEAAKKEPTTAQKAARNRMKDCGAEWRQLKAENKTEGKTWRTFSRECLREKKS